MQRATRAMCRFLHLIDLYTFFIPLPDFFVMVLFPISRLFNRLIKGIKQMVTQNTFTTSILSTPVVDLVEDPTSHLRQEYESLSKALSAQMSQVQRFLEIQAGQLAEALIQRQAQIRFALPDRIVLQPNSKSGTETCTIVEKDRQQIVGGLVERLARNDSRTLVRQRLIELELSAKPGVSLAARLLRYLTAAYMVNQMLPSGRRVTYAAIDGEDIPTVPDDNENELASALTAESDAVVEDNQPDERGELQVPYTAAARRFYLPQWVILDDAGQLLTTTVNEAEARIASMQNYLEILHAAIALAPYLVADPGYQQKRYGMLGQLVNQGRAIAAYETNLIIQKITRRATSQELNRGLSLSLPYFDDQALEVRFHNFDIIPAGRIMFIPAFVVRASRQEQVKVAQDTRYSPSTRKHLLSELETLEKAFD
jgi:hypothetical protein